MTQDDLCRIVGQLYLTSQQEKTNLLSELRRVTEDANQRIQVLTQERDTVLAERDAALAERDGSLELLKAAQ